MKDTKEKPQIDRFKEAARKLGCDEDEAAFDEKVKAIVKPGGNGGGTTKSAPKTPKT